MRESNQDTDNTTETPRTLRLDHGTVDLAARVFRPLTGPEVPLRDKEWATLRALAQSPGVTLTRGDLMRRAWGTRSTGTRTVDTTIQRLRGKIEQDPSNPRVILTIHGEGYRLVLPEEQAGPMRRSGEWMVVVAIDVWQAPSKWDQHPTAMSEACATLGDRFRFAGGGGVVVGSHAGRFRLLFTDVDTAMIWLGRELSALGDLDWPAALTAPHPMGADGPSTLWLRCAVDSGEVNIGSGLTLTGATVANTTALLRLAGPGQVLVSNATWQALGQAPRSELGDAVSWGTVPLPGQVSGFEVYAWTPARLRSVVPLDPPQQENRTNLPEARDGFVGRTEPLARLRRLWEEGQSVVTVLGPPGTGKTRLATEMGHRTLHDASGGVWFFDLATATSVDDMVAEVARVLRHSPSPAAPVRELARALSALGRSLVIFDNFEQLPNDAAQVVAEWSRAAPACTLLVTSQARLRIEGEQVLVLEPLSEDDGVQLFVAAARNQDPWFEAIGAEQLAIRRIVALLDGIPLAIELAAVRTSLMAPSDLLDRLAKRLDLLRSNDPGRPERHQTLRNAIDWAWSLLDEAEQGALSQCGVFRGGFDLELAETVVVVEGPPILDLVQTLEDRSFVQGIESRFVPGHLRFTMLESIRLYAEERLAARPDAEAVRERFREAILARTRPWCTVEHSPMVRYRHVAPERENLLSTALHALQSSPPDHETAGMALVCLEALVGAHGRYEAFLEQLAMVDWSAVSPRVRVEGLVAEATSLSQLLRMKEATNRIRAAEQTLAEVDDVGLTARVLKLKGKMLRMLGRLDRALPPLQRAADLFAELRADWHLSDTVLNIGHVQILSGDIDTAQATYRSLERDFEHLPSVRGRTRQALANIALDQGEIDAALSYSLQALDDFEGGENSSLVSSVRIGVDRLRLLRGENIAETELLESLRSAEATGMRLHHGLALSNIALMQSIEGRWGEAAATYFEVGRLLSDLQATVYRCFASMGVIAAARAGRFEEAEVLLHRLELSDMADPTGDWILARSRELLTHLRDGSPSRQTVLDQIDELQQLPRSEGYLKMFLVPPAGLIRIALGVTAL